MDKAIITVFMIVAGVIAAALVVNAAYPAIVQGNSTMLDMKSRVDDRLRSDIAIVHVAKSGDYADLALVWVKNIGASSIRPIERCDVFFGPEGDFVLIPFGSGDPHWDYVVENDSYWKPSATLRISVDLDYVLAPGERYFAKVVTPNGISDEYFFSPRR